MDCWSVRVSSFLLTKYIYIYIYLIVRRLRRTVDNHIFSELHHYKALTLFGCINFLHLFGFFSLWFITCVWFSKASYIDLTHFLRLSNPFLLRIYMFSVPTLVVHLRRSPDSTSNRLHILWRSSFLLFSFNLLCCSGTLNAWMLGSTYCVFNLERVSINAAFRSFR